MLHVLQFWIKNNVAKLDKYPSLLDNHRCAKHHLKAQYPALQLVDDFKLLNILTINDLFH